MRERAVFGRHPLLAFAAALRCSFTTYGPLDSTSASCRIAAYVIVSIRIRSKDYTSYTLREREHVKRRLTLLFRIYTDVAYARPFGGCRRIWEIATPSIARRYRGRYGGTSYRWAEIHRETAGRAPFLHSNKRHTSE